MRSTENATNSATAKILMPAALVTTAAPHMESHFYGIALLCGALLCAAHGIAHGVACLSSKTSTLKSSTSSGLMSNQGIKHKTVPQQSTWRRVQEALFKLFYERGPVNVCPLSALPDIAPTPPALAVVGVDADNDDDCGDEQAEVKALRAEELLTAQAVMVAEDPPALAVVRADADDDNDDDDCEDEEAEAEALRAEELLTAQAVKVAEDAVRKHSISLWQSLERSHSSAATASLPPPPPLLHPAPPRELALWASRTQFQWLHEQERQSAQDEEDEDGSPATPLPVSPRERRFSQGDAPASPSARHFAGRRRPPPPLLGRSYSDDGAPATPWPVSPRERRYSQGDEPASPVSPRASARRLAGLSNPTIQMKMMVCTLSLRY